MTAAANDSVSNAAVNEDDQNDDIIPLEQYNFEQGKLLASLSWLISKVYGKNVPDTLIQPCYRDNSVKKLFYQSNALHLKPGTMYSLTSSELYCCAAATIFHDAGYLNQNHATILQALKRYSIQVVDADENVVTETVLTQTAPFKLNAHLAMIDALMIAYTREIISVPRVVQCLKKYVNVHQSETPSDVEDAVSFWINKICAAVRDNLEKNQVSKNADLPVIPEMDDLYEDVCDGACVATLISFYAHDQLNLRDICFNDPMSFGDCLHNLRLIKTFCCKYLPWNIFHFAYEDVLYIHESLQPNVLAFITDLFNIFESTQDVKSPPVGASVTKRFFNRVGIPDLRGGERDPTLKHNEHKTSVVPRPTKLTHAPTKEPLTVTNSVGTSRMNSTDSLMTERSCDSLRYQAYKTSNTVETPLTPSTTFAENVIDTLASRHSPTTPVDHVNAQNGITNANYIRSDSLNGPDSIKAPSYAVRMQLDERRRQIEAQQMMEKSERFKQGQQINKDAFMKLYGKHPMSASMTTQPNVDASKFSEQHRSSSTTNNNLAQYDEISKSILEIKEQMIKLSLEQERMQNFVINPQSQNFVSSTPPPTMVHSYEGDVRPQPAPYQQIDVRQQPVPYQQPFVHAQSPPSLLTTGPFLSNGHTLIRYSQSEAEPFRLHNDDETPSRLDPALELSNNLSTWGGVTYKVNKNPRRTWENQGYVDQGHPNAGSVYGSLPPHQVELQQMHQQQQQFMQAPPSHQMVHMPMVVEEMSQPKSSPPYVEIVPAEPNWNPPQGFTVHHPSVTIYNNVPFAPPSSSSYVVVSMAPSTTVIPSYNDSVSSLRPVQVSASSSMPFVQPQTPSTVVDEDDASKYFTPAANMNANGHSSNGPLNETQFATPASIVELKPLNRSPSPNSGVGFVVQGDENTIADELIRKKELMVANAIRRKRQLERRREVLDEDNLRRQEEAAKKEENEKQRKREKEMRRIKVFEEYQRKKAEQETLGIAKASSISLKTGSFKGHRPPSPAVGKSITNVRSTSAENLDQVDGKSQSSDGAGSSSQISEPAVKLFVKPSQKSNRSIIYNALQFCVLAGSVNDDKKRKCLEELAKSDYKHFLILFRDQKCQFRGLFGWDQSSDVVHKLFGLGPSSCSEKCLNYLFKYDSGAKQFTQIPSKHFSATIDGFTIEDSFWQNKKPMYAKSKTMK